MFHFRRPLIAEATAPNLGLPLHTQPEDETTGPTVPFIWEIFSPPLHLLRLSYKTGQSSLLSKGSFEGFFHLFPWHASSASRGQTLFDTMTVR